MNGFESKKETIEKLQFIGQPIPRKDGTDIVTGNVTYGGDVSFPGMLHGKILRSPIASGRVARIDVAKARALPGVKTVITASDVRTHPFGYAITDEMIFASERIRYAGDAIAAVAAVDDETADHAAQLIEVEYEESPGVFDVLEAIRDGAPLVHEKMSSYKANPVLTRLWNPKPGTNVLHEARFSRGNVEEGFRDADFVFEDSFRTRRVHHCYLEPHACVARTEGAKITVWTATQRPFVVRSELATIFGTPESSIRIITTKVGGGFGGKNGVRLEHYAVALAMKTGRPVKVVMRRDEEFTASAGSVPAVIVMKTGVKRDGTFTAREAKFLWDCGAYSDSLPTSNRAVKDAAGPYRISHVSVISTLVYTNTLRGCPFRGLGCPEAVWAGESQIDMIAHRLDFDPVEFRLKNLLENGDTAPTGEVLENVTAKECLKKVSETAKNWTSKALEKDSGLGISMVYKSPTGAGAVSSAVVHINGDGSVHVQVGSSDVGGGMETILAQIAAEEFGIGIEDVQITSADTSAVPFDHGTYSSRVTVSSGKAVRYAAADARAKLLDIAGKILQQDPALLMLQNKQIWARDFETGIPVQKILYDSSCLQKQVTGLGLAYEDGSKTGWRFGAQAVEIQVDSESGVIRVVRVASVHDVGKAINPPLVSGQVEGAVVMGLGYALREKLHLEDGRITNPRFSDYGLPFAQEIPAIESIILESPLPVGPFGAKGVGEMGDFGIAPAIANAVENAVGVRMTELPLSPESVLDALESRKRP